MNNVLYENLSDYFPFVARDAIEYKEIGPFELMIRLNDGSVVMYDDSLRSIRNLPSRSDELTEEQCRREFGIRLHKLLKRKNITQNELSERTGISINCISKYITGRRTPSFYSVDKIAKALDCSADIFRYE